MITLNTCLLESKFKLRFILAILELYTVEEQCLLPCIWVYIHSSLPFNYCQCNTCVYPLRDNYRKTSATNKNFKTENRYSKVTSNDWQ